jgi:hypothetical protein
MSIEDTKTKEQDSEVTRFLNFCRKYNLGYIDENDHSLLFNFIENANAAFVLLKENGFNVIKIEPNPRATTPDKEAYIRIKIQ